MRYAWIDEGSISDICDGNPDMAYHPTVAAYYTEMVSEEERAGDTWDGAMWHHPPTPDPPTAPPVVPVKQPITRVDFLLRFSGQERISIRLARKTDPVIEDLWDILDQLNEVYLDHPTMVEGVAYLESAGFISPGRGSAILE